MLTLQKLLGCPFTPASTSSRGTPALGNSAPSTCDAIADGLAKATNNVIALKLPVLENVWRIQRDDQLIRLRHGLDEQLESKYEKGKALR